MFHHIKALLKRWFDYLMNKLDSSSSGTISFIYIEVKDYKNVYMLYRRVTMLGNLDVYKSVAAFNQ